MSDDFNPFKTQAVNVDYQGRGTNTASKVYRGDQHDPFSSMANDDVFSDASITAAASQVRDSPFFYYAFLSKHLSMCE
jgi:hypothetical protein